MEPPRIGHYREYFPLPPPTTGAPPVLTVCDVGKIKIPVQARFGSKDLLEGFSSLKDAKALAEKVDATGPSNELHMSSPSQLIQITQRKFVIWD